MEGGRASSRYFTSPLMTWVVVGGALMIAATIGLVVSELVFARHATLARTERISQSTARMLAEQTYRSIDGVALTMHAVADAIQQTSDRRVGSALVRDILRSRTRTAIELRDLAFVPADGTGTVDVTGNPVPPIRLDTLPYVREAIRSPGTIVLGPPVAGRHLGESAREAAAGGQFYIPMARTVTTSEGYLLGVVVGLLNPDFFVASFEAVEAGQQGVVRLMHYGGELAASTGAADGPPGTVMSGLPIFHTELPRKERGTYRGRDPDGIERVTTFRVLRSYPMLVSVGLSVTEALDGWRQEAASFVVLGGATIGLIGIGMFLLWRQVRTVQRRERELAKSEALKSGILASALDGIVSIDEDGRIIEFNPAAERIFARRRADVLGEQVGALLFPDGEGGSLDGLLAAAGSGSGERSELPAVRADGVVFPAEITVTASRTDDGRVFTAYLRDITERRRTEAELLASRERADAANRAKSDFLATISHEIRTPMNGIIGMASILQDTPLSAEQQRYLATIHSSSEALLRLIDDLLDFSRLEAGRLKLDLAAIEPGPVAAAAIDLVAPLAQSKGLMLAWRLAAGVPDAVRSDAGRLRQILLNLLGNAIKFTAAGSVTLTVEPADAGGAIRFVVADTGIGIPAEAQDRVFGRFEQVDTSITRRFGGSGLGLAISKRLVERMGGRIGVESRPGEGSRFWFTVPAVGGRHPGEEAPPTGQRVLVVDPDPAVRAILVDQMRDWSVAADGADGGPEAERLAAAAEADGRPYRILAARRDFAGLPTVPRRIVVAERPGPRVLSPVHPDGLRRELEREAAGGPALRILVAEDNPTNQQILATILRSLGHRVTLAQNGREALDRAAADDFDLVLMDIQMPEMSGIEATRRIRALPPPRGRVPIVAATAMGSPEDRAAFLDAGMNGLLVKPITRAAVERAIAGEAHAAAAPDEPPAAPDLDEAVPGSLTKALGAETFRRLVGQLIDQTPAMLVRLDEASQSGDAARLRATAHALSGSLRSFGLVRAAMLARSVETLARSGQVAEAQTEARRIPEAARVGLDLLAAMADARR